VSGLVTRDGWTVAYHRAALLSGEGSAVHPGQMTPHRPSGGDPPGMRIISGWTAAIALLAALALGGCSSEPPQCAALNSVRVSFEHLRDTNVAQNGLDQLRTNLTEVRTALEELKADLHTTASAQVDAVRTSAQQVRTDLQAAQANPSGPRLGTLRASLLNLRGSVQNLITAVSATC